MGIDRIGDSDEMLKKLRGHILGRRVILRKFERDGKQGAAIKRHPRGAVSLLETSAGRERLRAIEDADVVQAQKAAAENVLSLRVLAIDPPGKVDHELLEGAREKNTVPLAAITGHFVGSPARPCMHGRIHIAKRELISGNLAVWV